MRFKAALSTKRDTGRAARELVEAIGDLSPNLVLVFVSHHHADEVEALLARLRSELATGNLIGCTGESIIGPNQEVEHAPAVSIWAAEIPDARVLPFLIDMEDVERFESAEDWRDRVGMAADDAPALIVLPDPFSIDVEHCLGALEMAYPGAKIVGGVASGANGPGQNRLLFNDQILRQGLVGVALSGPVRINTIVSQGARPIGEPYVITRAERNIIYELRGKPALGVLQKVYQKANAEDQTLMSQGNLHVGTVIDEHQRSFSPGDFLIRNLMGAVDGGAIAVAALIRPGQTIQFHVRDADSADEEMRQLLRTRIEQWNRPPAGGLLFSCNGRGTRMFNEPNHDIRLISEAAEGIQVAGFFAAGEIGPVGAKTFVHGLTSSLILFREPNGR